MHAPPHRPPRDNASASLLRYGLGALAVLVLVVGLAPIVAPESWAAWIASMGDTPTAHILAAAPDIANAIGTLTLIALGVLLVWVFLDAARIPLVRLYGSLTQPELYRAAHHSPRHAERLEQLKAEPRADPAARSAPRRDEATAPDPQQGQADPREALPAIEAVAAPAADGQGEKAWDALILPSDTKAELRNLQKLLADPTRLEREWGISFAYRGMILSGPPGTGKTSIAKAIAASAGYTFYAIDPATMKSMWIGQSEKIVKAVYEQARENAPAVVFLDEIDAVASKRGSADGDGGGAGRAANSLVNQLLQEIDGFQSGDKRVFTIAATNRPDNLDDALKSRLNYNVEVGLPDREARHGLLSLFLAPYLERDRIAVPIDELVDRSEGMSGRDLKNFADALPQIALSLDHEQADQTVVDQAFRRVLPPTEGRGIFR